MEEIIAYSMECLGSFFRLSAYPLMKKPQSDLLIISSDGIKMTKFVNGDIDTFLVTIFIRL